MSRRSLVLLSLLALSAALATPALAQSHVIAQKSSKSPQGSVFLSARLTPLHTYRIEVSGTRHLPFLGSGTEHVVGVYKGRLFTGDVPLKLTGTTPHSFTVAQPSTAKVSEWILAVGVQLKSGRGLTIRFVDLGRHK